MNIELPAAGATGVLDDPHQGIVPPSSVGLAPIYAAAPALNDRRRFNWQRFGGKFLVLSVLAHLLFGAVAAYFIVQRVAANRKLTFQSGPKGANAPTRALEHKVQMKKQNTLSAPPQAKRVTTTGIAKVALPDMPAMPSMSAALSPGAISGMGAAGLAPGGLGGGMGGLGGNGSGAMTNFFGARSGGIGLTGTFYDFKQDRSRKPTTMDVRQYEVVVDQFVKGGFNEGAFANYYKADKPLYAPQIFIPRIPADEGPKAFNLQGIVQPKLWVALYKGRVIAPESGTFQFVGAGDDVLIVRFDNKIVVDGSIHIYVKTANVGKYVYQYQNDGWYKGHGHCIGEKISVLAGTSHSIEILIGEQPGGFMQASLLLQKEGAEYKKDATGNPILPIFRMSDVKTSPNNAAPVFDPGGLVWRTEASDKPKSFFDSAR